MSRLCRLSIIWNKCWSAIYNRKNWIYNTCTKCSSDAMLMIPRMHHFIMLYYSGEYHHHPSHQNKGEPVLLDLIFLLIPFPSSSPLSLTVRLKNYTLNPTVRHFHPPFHDLVTKNVSDTHTTCTCCATTSNETRYRSKIQKG